ncbi:alpha/beta-hydrolase [Pyrenochaeta sp. DS3sAY3a]|nr:alpha/beta-hydrolase [Pyrenochaeta sp. DS3sAY3a]
MASTEVATNMETKDRPFGPSYIVEPKSEHTHTAVMLHGRGSTGKEFAEEFLESTLSDGCSLSEKLPGCRWVFPSSQELWSTMFQEDMPAWFEAHSLTDITARQDLQVSGIRVSVDHVTAIVHEEIRRLDGNPQKLLLGGISQGGAVVLWTLLCQQDPAMVAGAVVVASTWLPFAANIDRTLARQPGADEIRETEFDRFVKHMIAIKAYPDVELGRQAARIFIQAGLPVEWKEFSDAEEEGHWFKIPDEMDDIHSFLGRVGWLG